MRRMTCSARVHYAGLFQSDQDVHLLMGVGTGNWNMHLTRGTLQGMNIWKIRKQNQ